MYKRNPEMAALVDQMIASVDDPESWHLEPALMWLHGGDPGEEFVLNEGDCFVISFIDEAGMPELVRKTEE